MRIILIGVKHRIQWIPQNTGLEWQQDLDQFAAHIRDIVLEAEADLLAEELSEENIRSSNARDSVARNIASSLGITHIFCDPDTRERRQFAIETDDQRELLWLARLGGSSASAAVFICGDSHMIHFDQKPRLPDMRYKLRAETAGVTAGS